MPPFPIEPSQSFAYAVTDLPGGPRLHFLSHPVVLPGTVSLTVTVDFGSVHLKYRDASGLRFTAPPGLSHFMEHFLFWLQFDDLILPMEQAYMTGPNAIVSYDFSRWGIRRAIVDPQATIERAPVDDLQQSRAVAELVRRFLKILLPSDSVVARAPDILTKTKNDIANEILYRHSSLDYPLHCKLRKALYPRHPIRYDILGTKNSIHRIELAHVQHAMAMIRSRIRSVMVLVHGYSIPDELREGVAETVTEMLAHTQAPSFHPEVVAAAKLEGHCNQEFLLASHLAQAIALVGVRLPPLHQAYGLYEGLRRAFVLTYLVSRVRRNAPTIHVLNSRAARAYIGSTPVKRPAALLDSITLSQLADQTKERMIELLVIFRDELVYKARFAFTDMVGDPDVLIKLCHLADDVGLILTDVLDAWAALSRTDVDQLITELRESSNNLALAYAGQDMDHWELANR